MRQHPITVRLSYCCAWKVEDNDLHEPVCTFCGERCSYYYGIPDVALEDLQRIERPNPNQLKLFNDETDQNSHKGMEASALSVLRGLQEDDMSPFRYFSDQDD